MTVRIHLSVDGQVAQSRSPSLPSHLILSSGPCPLDSDVPYLPSYRSSFNIASVVRTLSTCVPIPGTPSSAHVPTPKPPSRCLNWTMMAIPGRKPGCPEIGSGGECPPCGLMPHPIQSFPLPLVVKGSRPSWQSSMQTPAPPRPVPPPQFKVALAARQPTTAAHGASLDAWLTLVLRPPFYILFCIFSPFVPLSRFSVIIYLWTIRFIPCSGL